MIYSQYIEGGILPVSLALEEMGFTRFSSASYSKSFFETPPTEPIDALSLQPKSSLPKGQQFYPAKYVIISGDETFSPNNAEDIKHITNSNNKYGEKIKVVIISKAGAEGLDFKNIRQIHILEPWYNINRIEQIIGRGVRNKSHCLLPFEERNVEIFIYSSLMKSTPTEECADTYVYRFAEKKSIQIGKITRLLKETSVDCLLNIGQTNFSVEKIMSVLENTKIKQQLTSENGKEIDYQIGDKPFSSMCDYMDNCVYGCVANKETLEIKSDTYNIGYINNNQSIITKKIKDLFQERVAYSHKELIQILNHQKIYPIEQIYNSLTKLIENKEYITDKYERYGTIINKDDIYAFQPIEITDENISIYERSVPIEYKRKKVLLKVPENFYEVNEIKEPLNSVIDEPGVIQNNTPNVNYNPTIKNLWKNIETNYRVIISTDEETREYKKLSQKHKTFFINARLIMEYIEVIFQIPHKKIIQYLIFKMIDISSFKEKMGFAKELFLANPPPNPLFMEFPFLKDTIVTYFKNKMFNDKIMYITDDNYNFVLYRWSQKMEEWEEIHDKTPYISNIQKMIIIVPKIDTIVGFYKNSIFKMIDNILAKRNKGFDILQAQKQKIIQMYNYFIEKYNSLQTNIQLRKYTDKENIYKDELCVIVEILIRYIRETYGEKVFLTEDEASLIRLGEL
jgi:hypothetical protein